MLIPQGFLTVQEYDATDVVSPTSKFGHASDSVFSTVEMLVHNDQSQAVEFPFLVLSTDPGTGAESRRSVEPQVLNGSREVALQDDEIDEVQVAETMVQRAQAAGVADAAYLERVRTWSRAVLARAERTKRGRTRIKPGERRRIVLQQRIRILPQDGRYVFETIAPSPIATLATRGRVPLAVLLPWEDEDIRVQVLERTGGFSVEQGQLKARKWVAWHWQNDPVPYLVGDPGSTAVACDVRIGRIAVAGILLRQETAYAVTSLRPQRATPPQLLALWRGYWSVENQLHSIRDVAFDKDRATVRAKHAPQAVAAFRNAAIGVIRRLGTIKITATCCQFMAQPHAALAAPGA